MSLITLYRVIWDSPSEYISHLIGGSPSIIGSATHYLNPTISYTDSSWRNWGQGMVPKYIIGESPFSPDGSIDQNKQTHVFGNEDPGIFPKLYELEYNGCLLYTSDAADE